MGALVVDSEFDILHALCNLLVVVPENLRQVCTGTHSKYHFYVACLFGEIGSLSVNFINIVEEIEMFAKRISTLFVNNLLITINITRLIL